MRFFQLSTKIRRQHNKILKINRANNVMLEDIGAIRDEGLHFFQYLLGTRVFCPHS